MTNQIGNFVSIPTGEDIEKVRNAFEEIANALAVIKSQQTHIRDIKQMLKEDYEMTPKSITLMAKLNATQEADKYFAVNEEMETLYETIFTN